MGTGFVKSGRCRAATPWGVLVSRDGAARGAPETGCSWTGGVVGRTDRHLLVFVICLRFQSELQGKGLKMPLKKWKQIHTDISRSQESPGRANACKHGFRRPFVTTAVFPKDVGAVVDNKKKIPDQIRAKKGSASGP